MKYLAHINPEPDEPETEPEPLLFSVWDNEGTEYAIPFEVLIMYQI